MTFAGSAGGGGLASTTTVAQGQAIAPGFSTPDACFEMMLSATSS